MDKVIDKRGYLNADYMFFHLSDRSSEEHTFHYHEFDKIVILLGGKTSYIIEGREYFLEPWDVLLVNHHDIHMPVIDRDTDYDRVVIWLNRDFINSLGTQDCDLSLAFRISRERSMSLLKVPDTYRSQLEAAVRGLETEYKSTAFGAEISARAYMAQCLSLINRIAICDTEYDESLLCRYDAKISEIISYINLHLAEDLSLETVASRFYMSRSYLMHRFKEETGYTFHNYVLQKRLLYSKQLLCDGTPVTEAAYSSGFTEYTTFLRAFKKMFKCLPKDY